MMKALSFPLNFLRLRRTRAISNMSLSLTFFVLNFHFLSLSFSCFSLQLRLDYRAQTIEERQPYVITKSASSRTLTISPVVRFSSMYSLRIVGFWASHWPIEYLQPCRGSLGVAKAKLMGLSIIEKMKSGFGTVREHLFVGSSVAVFRNRTFLVNICQLVTVPLRLLFRVDRLGNTPPPVRR